MTQVLERVATSDFTIFTGALKAFEDAGRKIISCTASSSVVDLHGDEITPECVQDMASQAIGKGMTIFLNHSYQIPEDTFGRTIAASAAQRGVDESGSPIWDMDLNIEVDEENPRARQTYASIKGKPGKPGLTLGVSIGAQVKDWEWRDSKKQWEGGLRIKGVNLLEASIVGIPANPRSWVQNAVKSLRAKSLDLTDLGGVPDLEEAAPTACPSCDHPTQDEATCSCDSAFHSGSTDVEAGDVIASAEPDLVEESHPELPDSAFACIDSKGRHYPHHHADGTVWIELLRNALARIGDQSNTQCGKGHLMRHAKAEGIGEDKEAFFVVSMDDDIHGEKLAFPIDEFSADDHEPERPEDDPATDFIPTTPDDSLSSAPDDGDSRVEADVAETEPVASGDLEAIVRSAAELTVSDADRPILVMVLSTLERAAEELKATRSQLAITRTELESLKAERDKALEDVADAARIVEVLAKLPLGRKTRFIEPIASFRQRFSGIYDEDFLRLIDERQ